MLLVFEVVLEPPKRLPKRGIFWGVLVDYSYFTNDAFGDYLGQNCGTQTTQVTDNCYSNTSREHEGLGIGEVWSGVGDVRRHFQWGLCRLHVTVEYRVLRECKLETITLLSITTMKQLHIVHLPSLFVRTTSRSSINQSINHPFNPKNSIDTFALM